MLELPLMRISEVPKSMSVHRRFSRKLVERNPLGQVEGIEHAGARTPAEWTSPPTPNTARNLALRDNNMARTDKENPMRPRIIRSLYSLYSVGKISIGTPSQPLGVQEAVGKKQARRRETMKRTFGQRVMTLIAALGLTTSVGAAANASTGVAVGRTGSAPQSQFVRGATLAGLSLVPVTNPAVLAQRPANVSSTAMVFTLRNGADTNLCLDADMGTIDTNGTKIQVWTCTYQAPGWPASNQTWWVDYTSASTTIQSNRSGRCLDADVGQYPRQNGVKVQLWDCVSFASNQTWSWGDYVDLRNQKFSASCLNADGAYNGAKVHLWTCSGGQPRDQWYLSN
jgi:hypothetical protein